MLARCLTQANSTAPYSDTASPPLGLPGVLDPALDKRLSYRTMIRSEVGSRPISLQQAGAMFDPGKFYGMLRRQLVVR